MTGQILARVATFALSSALLSPAFAALDIGDPVTR